jgi:hypothetical protein
VFGSGERFEGFAKKGWPFRAAPVVLATVRLHDSRLGVDPHWGTGLSSSQISAPGS